MASRVCDIQRCRQPYLRGMIQWCVCFHLHVYECFGPRTVMDFDISWGAPKIDRHTHTHSAKWHLNHNQEARHCVASHCEHLVPNTQSAYAIVCRKQVLWGCLTTGREPQRWSFPAPCKMMICDMFEELQRASNPVLCPSGPIWGHIPCFSGRMTHGLPSVQHPPLSVPLIWLIPLRGLPPSRPKIHMKHSSCSRVLGQFLHLSRAFLALSRCALEFLSPERCRVKLDQFPVPY